MFGDSFVSTWGKPVLLVFKEVAKHSTMQAVIPLKTYQ
jgi:hypothetical protein